MFAALFRSRLRDIVNGVTAGIRGIPITRFTPMECDTGADSVLHWRVILVCCVFNPWIFYAGTTPLLWIFSTPRARFGQLKRMNSSDSQSFYVSLSRMVSGELNINMIIQPIFSANTGGLLGLFMGFSTISLVEILYFTTLRPYCNHKREVTKNRTDERSKMQHRITAYDSIKHRIWHVRDSQIHPATMRRIDPKYSYPYQQWLVRGR